MNAPWLGVIIACTAAGAALATPAHSAPAKGGCSVTQRSRQVEIRSPFFVLRLDTSDGLRARSFQNRLTGHTISLGDGAELGVDIGLPGGPLVTPTWRVVGVNDESRQAAGRVVFRLTAADPRLSADVTYEWKAEEPVLRKFVEITNRGAADLNRVLNVRLGTYRPDAEASSRERGFPLYIGDELLMSLAHPAGWAMAQDSTAELRQYPGVLLAPGQTFRSMEAVYGVGQAGEARAAFLAHLRSRMRRVVRGHDKPYAIFEPFGARPDGNFDESEEFVLDNIAKVAEGQRDSGCRFDIYSVDFWVDYRGDLKAPDPVRFPNGFTRIKEELAKLGTSPGLWIDSSWEAWSIGGNPAVQATLNYDPANGPGSAPSGRPSFCRATEPIRSMYTEAFRYHIRENGVRLIKFDNLDDSCNNPAHAHLPGIYSTQAIDDAVIECLHALDAECPDVFLVLYWGHRSPWWLLHGDTLFDSGSAIEAASPSSQPAPYARDSVTQRLDQAQWATQDVPWLGKDSLGVWFSSWGWNSSVGKERWQEGFIMDLCRGSMLAQPWSDTDWLSPPERRQMADFTALLKARPDCFGNPRKILGDPAKDEPYGYCCSNGERAFIALSNCAWTDSTLTLQLNREWGLPEGRRWQLYRWYPSPARLGGIRDTFGREAALPLRPFEVALIEAVPDGEAPTLDREFAYERIPEGFAEPTRQLDVHLMREEPMARPGSVGSWEVLRPISCTSEKGATLTPQEDGSILATGSNVALDTYTMTAAVPPMTITGFRIEALPDESLPDGGPGRAVNGNFALTDFSVTLASTDGSFAPAAVRLANAVADYSQEGYGGWPVTAAIDGNSDTGWSIDPQEGTAHTALFEVAAPKAPAEGTQLTFTLRHGMREHNLGRFRISVTYVAPPFAAPPSRDPSAMRLDVRVPSCSTPAMLVVSLQMRHGGEPLWRGNVGTYFTAEATMGGGKVECTPVLGTATYPAPWQAWRIALGPSRRMRPLRLDVHTKLTPATELVPHAYLVPTPGGAA